MPVTVPSATADCDMVKAVPLSTEETVVPLGIPVPVTVSPAVTVDVSLSVSVLLAAKLKM